MDAPEPDTPFAAVSAHTNKIGRVSAFFTARYCRFNQDYTSLLFSSCRSISERIPAAQSSIRKQPTDIRRPSADIPNIPR